MLRRLLVINPNTSQNVSALVQAHAQTAAGPGVRVRTVTARFGAPYIACEASYAVAAHATLDAWAAALASDTTAPDAVLIGCFGDPGLLALRQTSAVPVTGLAEAAFAQAAPHGLAPTLARADPQAPVSKDAPCILAPMGISPGSHWAGMTGVNNRFSYSCRLP